MGADHAALDINTLRAGPGTGRSTGKTLVCRLIKRGI